MRVKIRAKLPPATTLENDPARPEYPLRVSSFFVSAGAHCLGVAALLLVNWPDAAPRRPVYDELIKPHQRRILLYDLRKKAPDTVPLKKVGATPDPRGAELSKQAIVAMSPKPKSKEVFVLVPVPKIEIPRDMPAPLLIARLQTTLPPAPPPPEPIKPKQFVPPPPSKRPPKLPMQTPVLDAPAPPSSPSASPQLSAPTITFSAAVAPPRSAPEAPTARPGNARADIAVASLHPSENADAPVPNGERPGRFSKAPAQGAPSSGDIGASAALIVPDLTIRQPKPLPAAPAPPPPPPTQEILYAERVRSVPLSTLSVPLRPASRMIPRDVDARFQGRSVYAIVIPMEHMSSYSGDWIMWFSDRESKLGETPVVRAPIPFRKLEPVDQPPPSERTGERIQFAATLGRNGKLDGITLLTKVVPAVQRAVFLDVTSWEFQPATRDGAKVDVDVVLEIPFSLPTAIARSAP
jgi:hypothetical protein